MLYLLLALGLINAVFAEEDHCLSTTFVEFIPEDEGDEQDGCKGGKRTAIESTCSKSRSCDAITCRNECAADNMCKFYAYWNPKSCRLYKQCVPDKSSFKHALGKPTFAKVCNEFAGTIGVSWANLAIERWQTDLAALKAAVDRSHGLFYSKNANDDVEQQIQDIKEFVALDVDAIIILASDASRLGPALEEAHSKSIPVIAYDRLIDDEKVFYITFDNVEVGRMQAREILKAQPTGKYVFIKGSETDPNAHFVRQGQQEVLQAAIDANEITIVDEAFTPNWTPAEAYKNFEKILTDNGNDVDAVVASNDGTAGAVSEVLKKYSMNVPLSGQDGEKSALNRVAKGEQTVSVWKDARVLGTKAGELAVQLARNFDGFALLAQHCGSATFETPTGKKVHSLLLPPIAITKDNLDVVIDANWMACEDFEDEVKGCESS